MPSYRIALAQFPGGNRTVPAVGRYLAKLFAKLNADPAVSDVAWFEEHGTPITMLRNLALEKAAEWRADFVLMIDSDMNPDLPYPDAVPFWDAAFPFARDHAGPLAIAAPYCGPPPNELPYTFEFVQTETGNPNPNYTLRMHTREQAAGFRGIQRVAALPTGLFLLDMRALAKIPKPYFYYEFTDESQSHLASTEDVAFSRDLTYAGIPLYAAYDSWAGHYKEKMVGKPMVIPPEAVPQWITARAGELAKGPPAAAKVDEPLRAWPEKPAGRFLLSPKPRLNGTPEPVTTDAPS